MDRELPIAVLRQSRLKKYGLWAAIIVALTAVYFVFQALISPTLDRSRIITAVAEIGTIEATVSAYGVVAPEYEQMITAPISTTIEKINLNSGDSVKVGQSIMQLNNELLRIEYDKLLDELEVQKNRKQQLSLDTEKKQIDLLTSFEIKKMQTRFIQTQYDRMIRLHKIGGATTEDLEQAELNVNIAQKELSQLDDQIKNQQASLDVALEGLDLQISIQENRVSEIRRQIELTEARAARDGIITFVDENIGSSVASGDVVARVADLSSFKIEASISDIHADKLSPGGKVIIRIGDRTLPGRIGTVRPAVENGIMSFVVLPDDKSNRSLRPQLRVDIFVVTSFKENVLRVKNGPFYDGLVDQKIFVVDGDKAVRHIVDIGVGNFDYVELIGDIAAGDEIIVSDTKKIRHQGEVELKGQ